MATPDIGAIPQSTHDGETQPMEVDRIRRADPPHTFEGAPTQELAAVPDDTTSEEI